MGAGLQGATMKTEAMVAVAALVLMTGCATSRNAAVPSPTPPHRSEFSTGERVRVGEEDIEARAKSLERQGFTAKEARQYAEIEYLKSRAGSPLR
jgi:hypothetical protein